MGEKNEILEFSRTTSKSNRKKPKDLEMLEKNYRENTQLSALFGILLFE